MTNPRAGRPIGPVRTNIASTDEATLIVMNVVGRLTKQEADQLRVTLIKAAHKWLGYGDQS